MFLPENIDFTHVEKYILSIRLTPNGFSFCIHCPENPDIFYYKHTEFGGNKLSYLENVKKLIFDYNFFTYSFRETNVIVVSDTYTSVPDVFFEQKRMAELFAFNIRNDKNDKIIESYVEGLQFHVLFNIDKELYSFMMRNVWNPHFTHHAALLVPFCAKNSVENNNTCWVNFIDDTHIDIYFFAARQFCGANTYRVAENSDAAYYIANALEKQHFNQSNDKLLFIGDTTRYLDTVNVIKRLVRNTEIFEHTSATNIPEDNNVPADILTLLCV